MRPPREPHRQQVVIATRVGVKKGTKLCLRADDEGPPARCRRLHTSPLGAPSMRCRRLHTSPCRAPSMRTARQASPSSTIAFTTARKLNQPTR